MKFMTGYHGQPYVTVPTFYSMKTKKQHIGFTKNNLLRTLNQTAFDLSDELRKCDCSLCVMQFEGSKL